MINLERQPGIVLVEDAIVIRIDGIISDSHALESIDGITNLIDFSMADRRSNGGPILSFAVYLVGIDNDRTQMVPESVFRPEPQDSGLCY